MADCDLLIPIVPPSEVTMEVETTPAPAAPSHYTNILIEGERVPIIDPLAPIDSQGDVSLAVEDHLLTACSLDVPKCPVRKISSFKNRPRPKLNLDIDLAQGRPRADSLPINKLPGEYR